MLVAGELSGDRLGAGLIRALKVYYPDAHFFGIGGPSMIAEGLESLAPLEALSIMGLFEVIKELPKLVRLKNQLLIEARKNPPLAYIGIDAPDFNLRVAKAIKREQLAPTFQYVSPSIWVWRAGRVKQIKRDIDRVLCLFPFEVALYKEHQVDAICVGHRLGDEIPLDPDPKGAQKALNLPHNQPYLALLPGSRHGEIERLLPLFLESIELFLEQRPEYRILIPAATESIYQMIATTLEEQFPALRGAIHLYHGDSRLVMEASDSVLLASGTASLEAMLLKKPMVVAYRFNAFTAWLAPKIVKIRLFSLPNILAGEEIVPELFQAAVTADNIVAHLLQSLEVGYRQKIIPHFYRLHKELRLNSDQAAAKAIYEKLDECS